MGSMPDGHGFSSQRRPLKASKSGPWAERASESSDPKWEHYPPEIPKNSRLLNELGLPLVDHLASTSSGASEARDLSDGDDREFPER